MKNIGAIESTIKKISGDGLSVSLHSNEQILEVTGDGCSITMSRNHGKVKIIGDGCRLRIDQNTGDVEYTGDGGRVFLGLKSTKNKVKYIGDGGRVSLNGTWTENRKSKGTSKTEGGKGVVGGRRNSGMDNSGWKVREEAENVLNERKEGKRGGLARTRIVTTLEYDEKIVKRWFVDPETVIRTLGGAAFVKVVPK